MKTNYLLLAVLLFIAQSIYSQDNDTLTIVCSGKWHLEYLEMDGEKMYLSKNEQQNNWVIFHLDGKHEVSEEGEKYIGKWEYIADKKILRTNDRDGLVDQKIINLTDKVFILSVKQQGEIMLMGMKKIE